MVLIASALNGICTPTTHSLGNFVGYIILFSMLKKEQLTHSKLVYTL